jgi:hypothetical protein
MHLLPQNYFLSCYTILNKVTWWMKFHFYSAATKVCMTQNISGRSSCLLSYSQLGIQRCIPDWWNIEVHALSSLKITQFTNLNLRNSLGTLKNLPLWSNYWICWLQSILVSLSPCIWTLLPCFLPIRIEK